MSGELQTLWSPPAAPPVPLPLSEPLAIEGSAPWKRIAGSGDEPAAYDPGLGTPDACARLARTRDPLVVAEALAFALSDPLVAAERGTFDRMARELRAAFATIRPADAERFAARLDSAVGALGEQAIEWAPPTMPPLPANGSSTIDAPIPMPVETPRDGTDARTTTATTAPLDETTTPQREKEATIVSIDGHRSAARRAEGKAPLLNDWRAQLAAMAAELPARGTDYRGRARKTRRRNAQVATTDLPLAPDPETGAPPPPDLAALSARRARIVEADREQRARAEAALAERQGFLDRIARHGDELAAIRRERELTRQALADAFTDEARAGLASIATEIEQLDKACVAALATEEWSLARLERRPEVAALLARRGREEEAMLEAAGAAGATRRLPEEVTATVPPVAVGRSDDSQAHQLISAKELPNDPDQPALPEKVGQSPAAVKRPGALDTVERARRLLRAGDADGALGVLGGLDARGLDREVERQVVGVLFAAAEASARAGGMDDFRFLRLDRGTRVLLACEPAAAYAAGDAAAAPTYRVVATYGLDGDRFAPGEAVPAGLLERAQPRRARS